MSASRLPFIIDDLYSEIRALCDREPSIVVRLDPHTYLRVLHGLEHPQPYGTSAIRIGNIYIERSDVKSPVA